MTDFNTLFKTMKFKDVVEKKTIETLFNFYMSDIPDNFYLNQFELSSKYTGSSYEDWVKVLTYPAFNSWKSEQIALIATTQTDKALAGGEDMSNKDALSLLQARQKILEPKDKNNKQVIIVLPTELFFTEE